MSSIVKAVISIYRRGEEKPIERYKARISVTEDSTKQGIDNFKKHLADFLGLKEEASKLGLGSFDLKRYPCLRHLTVPLSLSDEKIPQVLIGTEPEPFQMVEQALNTSSGKGGDVITLIIHIVAIVEDQ